MAIKAAFIALVICFGLVHAQERGSMTVYREPGCRTDSADFLKHELYFPVESGGDGCTDGSVTLQADWPTALNGDYIMYYDSRGIGAGCRLGILDGGDRAPQFCGIPRTIVDGDNPGACQQGFLPRDYGIVHCCGTPENCQPVLPPTGRVASTSPAEDFALMRRSNPFDSKIKQRQDGCSFAGGAVYESIGSPQTITNVLTCGDAGGCTISNDTTVTRGSSQTFGAGIDVTTGVALFATIQTTVSFSYDYTFEESKSTTASYRVGVGSGQSGVIIYTPFTECVMGTLSGDCGAGIETGVERQACVPVNGLPMGEFSFLATT